MKLWHLVSAFTLLAEPFVVADLAYCATDNTGSSYSAGKFISNAESKWNGAAMLTSF